MIDRFIAFVATNAVFVTFCVSTTAIFFGALGLWIGHHLSLNRDRRKEFNDLADPTRNQLRRELHDTRYGAIWTNQGALSTLGDMLSRGERGGFNTAVTAYREAREQHTTTNSLGERSFTRTDHVAKAIHGLLAELERR